MVCASGPRFTSNGNPHVLNENQIWMVFCHDDRCRTSFTLVEMGWFVAFTGSPSYQLMTIIPKQRNARFIREQYPLSFDGSGTMTLRQASTLC
ncbi:hypothetical protein TNCV_1270651 [Trichonephila clavipes]|nr:hypothetical protein TNCV_1270651 [Trichonephila clavipes]